MACDFCISTIFMILLKVSKPKSSINAPNEELKNDVDITEHPEKDTSTGVLLSK